MHRETSTGKDKHQHSQSTAKATQYDAGAMQDAAALSTVVQLSRPGLPLYIHLVLGRVDSAAIILQPRSVAQILRHDLAFDEQSRPESYVNDDGCVEGDDDGDCAWRLQLHCCCLRLEFRYVPYPDLKAGVVFTRLP